MTGQRVDYRLQECQGPQLKRTFPDLGYVFMGYNVLQGYPLAMGHDPGFSLPIFKADYSVLLQTPDCRYRVPKGVNVNPDVSCVTSFSSRVIKSVRELQSSLSVSAKVEGGGWGVKFSASAGYKQANKEISSGDYLYILSTASCTYYYSKLEEIDPPPFDARFIKWVQELDQAQDGNQGIYFDFFNLYGTHYLIEVTFGAHFTYQHRMKAKKLETASSSEFSIGVQASYSGAFSVGGGFNMDSSQRQAAMDFQKSVETTTITVGAPPPANGDAMTWASTVKDSPVPVKYKLKSIEHLFTEHYMEGLGVNFTRIHDMIKTTKHAYCWNLKVKGEVESCVMFSRL